MDSPFLPSHAPTSFKRVTNSSWMVPSGLGPIFSRKLALLPAARTEIAIEISSLGALRVLARSAEREIVRVVPVQMRVVEEKAQTLPPALVGKRLENVFAVRSRVH